MLRKVFVLVVAPRVLPPWVNLTPAFLVFLVVGSFFSAISKISDEKGRHERIFAWTGVTKSRENVCFDRGRCGPKGGVSLVKPQARLV